MEARLAGMRWRPSLALPSIAPLSRCPNRRDHTVLHITCCDQLSVERRMNRKARSLNIRLNNPSLDALNIVFPTEPNSIRNVSGCVKCVMMPCAVRRCRHPILVWSISVFSSWQVKQDCKCSKSAGGKQ